MTADQMASLKQRMHIGDGEEWEPFSGLGADPEDLRAFLDAVPFNQRPARGAHHSVPVSAGTANRDASEERRRPLRRRSGAFSATWRASIRILRTGS